MASGLCAALTGRTHGCTDQPANVKKTLANSEPSTHGTKLTYRSVPPFVRFRGDCVAKLSLRRWPNRDSVEWDGDLRERSMMGRREGGQGQFFYAFDLDEVVPRDHLVRQIDAVLDLNWVHKELAPHYSHTGRPSIDPIVMIRMLIVGYVFA